MAFAGLRGTGDFSTDERPKNFRETILFLSPNGNSPLFALTAKMADESTDDPEFAWWEEDLDVPRLFVTTAGSQAANAGSTNIQVDTATAGTRGDSLFLVPGDLLMVESIVAGVQTYEVLEVSSVTDASNFVVKRAVSGTTIATIPAGSALTRIGNAYGEGTTSPNVSARNPTKKYNYAQIFKTAYELTETVKVTKTRTGDPLKNDKYRRMFDHSSSIEQALFFGRRFEQASGPNGKPRRYTGGLLDPNIGLSTTIFATAPTENDLMTSFESMFQKSPDGIANERIAFCGNGFLNAINRKVKDSASTRITYQGQIDVYGMKLMKFMFPYGEIAFKTHPLLTRNTRFTNSCFVLAPAALKVRNLRKTRAQDNIQANDADTQKGQWLTEMGVEIHWPSLMGHFNITNPAG